MFDLLTFGEAMVRFTPDHYKVMEQADTFRCYVGGSELNTAVGLARLGMKTAWISKLPDNPLGRLILNKAREQGVDTGYIVRDKENRAGLYFMEQGASPRPSQVIYDRQYSSFTTFRFKEADWETLIKGTKWVHLSGITSGLNADLARVNLEILKLAKARGCMTSYDLNYRSRLWPPDEARKAQEPMMEYIDVLVSTEEDIVNIFKIGDIKEEKFQDLDKERYFNVAEEARKKFGLKIVCLTLRENKGVLHNTWTAIACSQGKRYEDEKRELEVIDRVGAGDSFTAGFIFGYLEKKDIRHSLRFGNAFACLKHSIPGDFNLCTRDDVERLLKKENLRIKR
ncbi:MAG: sugar kinase [bacterium]|nr:sugar kinase [bacterium]